MSWDLIKSIQKNGADLRLIMPFGLALKPGDVISVGGKDGSFRLEGTCNSILGRGRTSDILPPWRCATTS